MTNRSSIVFSFQGNSVVVRYSSRERAEAAARAFFGRLSERGAGLAFHRIVGDPDCVDPGSPPDVAYVALAHLLAVELWESTDSRLVPAPPAPSGSGEPGATTGDKGLH